jgi:hypothetical protein
MIRGNLIYVGAEAYLLFRRQELLEIANELVAQCSDVKEIATPGHSNGKSLAAPAAPPKKRALPMVTSSSKGSARADDEKPVWQRVLEIIKAKGEADVAAVV